MGNQKQTNPPGASPRPPIAPQPQYPPQEQPTPTDPVKHPPGMEYARNCWISRHEDLVEKFVDDTTQTILENMRDLAIGLDAVSIRMVDSIGPLYSLNIIPSNKDMVFQGLDKMMQEVKQSTDPLRAPGPAVRALYPPLNAINPPPSFKYGGHLAHAHAMKVAGPGYHPVPDDGSPYPLQPFLDPGPMYDLYNALNSGYRPLADVSSSPSEKSEANPAAAPAGPSTQPAAVKVRRSTRLRTAKQNQQPNQSGEKE